MKLFLLLFFILQTTYTFPAFDRSLFVEEYDNLVGESYFVINSTLKSPIHSLVSKPRQKITALLAYQSCGLSGQFVETGVYKGGTSVIMGRIAKTCGKHVYACDSFQGLPSIQLEDKRKCQKINGTRSCAVGFQGQYRSSLTRFQSYVNQENLTNIIKVIKGWFHMTLPTLSTLDIAFLRLDGDVYNSTMEALRHLYPLVVKGGYVYIDDYGSYVGCRNAVNDYFKGSLTFETVLEEDGRYEAIWFKK